MSENIGKAQNVDARPVGVAMSDGTVRPFNEVLGGINELAARRGKPKTTVATWWARGRRKETKYEFPQPVAVFSTGPLWFPPDIDGYVPGDGRWADREEKSGGSSAE